MPDWTAGDEDGRLAEWAGVGRHKLAQAPRAGQGGTSLPREMRCRRGCRAQMTGDPRDCVCHLADQDAYEREQDAIYERERDRE